MARSVLDWIVVVLLIIGGVNWGLYAFGYDLVELILGSVSWLATIVYVLVGLAAIWRLVKINKAI